MSISIPALLVGLLLCPGEAKPAPASATATPVPSDGAPVAIVNGEPLSRGAYKEYLLQTYASDQTLEAFIAEKLMADRAKKDGIVVTDKDADDWIEDRVKQAAEMPDFQGLDPVVLRQKYKPLAKRFCLIERLIKRDRV